MNLKTIEAETIQTHHKKTRDNTTEAGHHHKKT